MKNLEIKETEIMTDYGFFVVETACGEFLNICLALRSDENGYKKEIKRSDSGFDDGICGYTNEKAINKYGRDEVLSFLLKSARKSGLRVV